MTNEETNPFRSKLAGPDYSTEPTSGSRWKTYRKLCLLSFFVLLVAFALFQLGETLSLENLAKQENQLRQFQSENPYLVLGIAFSVYVGVTGLSLPGATGLTLVYGWYFGFWKTLVLVSFASTMGATLAFLLSRYLVRDAIRNRFGDRLGTFEAALSREGPFYLFTLRLIPAVPFFVINAVMGLTPIPARTFWWVSQIGMLPGTIVYVYAGSRVPNLKTLAENGIAAVFTPSQVTQILIALALLGLFPLVVRYALGFFAKHAKTSQSST